VEEGEEEEQGELEEMVEEEGIHPRKMDLLAKGIILPVIHLSIHLLIHAYGRVEERKKEDRKGKNTECLVAIEMRKDQGESLKGSRSFSSIGSALTEAR